MASMTEKRGIKVPERPNRPALDWPLCECGTPQCRPDPRALPPLCSGGVVSADPAAPGPVCRICRTGEGTRRVASVPTASGSDRPVYGCPEHADGLRRAADKTLRVAEALLRIAGRGAS